MPTWWGIFGIVAVAALAWWAAQARSRADAAEALERKRMAVEADRADIAAESDEDAAGAFDERFR